jgi:hypothetical protein
MIADNRTFIDRFKGTFSKPMPQSRENAGETSYSAG